MIRYLKITQVDGTRYILRVTKESSKVIRGYEVNANGDEIVPPGACNRLRIVGRDFIAKIVPMRMNNKYATLEPDPESEATKSIVNIVTDAATLAEAMYPGGGLSAFNEGAYEGTTIPIRKLTGREIVTVAGSSSGAKVLADETWISDRFGNLGARQIARLRELTKESAR
jgi:hypothetical protein